MHQMYFSLIRCDTVEPIHVSAIKGPSYVDAVFIYRDALFVATFITAEWHEQKT